jgi:DNA-binding Lrp family transcriptional regulator
MILAANKNNIPLETIAKMVDLSIEQIKDIIKK